MNHASADGRDHFSQLVVFAGGLASRQSMGSAQQGRRGGRDQRYQCCQTKAICFRCLILLLILLFGILSMTSKDPKTAAVNCISFLVDSSSTCFFVCYVHIVLPEVSQLPQDMTCFTYPLHLPKRFLGKQCCCCCCHQSSCNVPHVRSC